MRSSARIDTLGRMRWWLWFAGLFGGLAGTGCASATVQAELRQLRLQITENESVRREQAKRLDELESRLQALVGEGDHRRGETAPRETIPPLPVVTLRPEKEPAEGTARLPATAAPVAGDASPPGLALSQGAGSKGAGSAKELYRRGRSQLAGGHPREAMATLGELVERFPRDTLADDAEYLLGELHYARRGYMEAMAAFREVLHRWPHGDKAAEAQLKLADCQFAQGRQTAGREALRVVIARYPRSPVARLARRRLTQHGGGGR